MTVGQARRKSHWLRNTLLVLLGLFVLGIGACGLGVLKLAYFVRDTVAYEQSQQPLHRETRRRTIRYVWQPEQIPLVGNFGLIELTTGAFLFVSGQTAAQYQLQAGTVLRGYTYQGLAEIFRKTKITAPVRGQEQRALAGQPFQTREVYASGVFISSP